jgi:Fe-S-cluster containining protein
MKECPEGCGKCCFHSFPPFLPRELAELPPEIRGDLTEADCVLGNPDQPCLWLDLSTMRCTHYEHRPAICRDFVVGGHACSAKRGEVEE